MTRRLGLVTGGTGGSMTFRHANCVDCHAKLFGDEIARCDVCRAVRARRARKKRKTPAHRAANAAWQRARYHQDPEKARKRNQAFRLGQKLDGRCSDCAADALPDNNRCAVHREANLAWEREHPRQRPSRTDARARVQCTDCHRTIIVPRVLVKGPCCDACTIPNDADLRNEVRRQRLKRRFA